MTVDGISHRLAQPFLVIATQNPIEYEGTYPLPEAQLDRFMVRLSLGYPSPEEEADMLAEHGAHDRVLDLEPVVDVGTVLAAQATAAATHGSEALRRYVVALCEATRGDPRVELGASPRGGADAVPRGEGARRAGGARPRAARRRAGAGAVGARSPPAARPRCRRRASARR